MVYSIYEEFLQYLSSNVEQAYWTVLRWILFSLPAFVIGIFFSVFHLLGKHPLFRHWLYITVTSLENLLSVRRKIPLVIPSIPGAFLPLKLFNRLFYFPVSKLCIVTRINWFLYRLPYVFMLICFISFVCDEMINIILIVSSMLDV